MLFSNNDFVKKNNRKHQHFWKTIRSDLFGLQCQSEYIVLKQYLRSNYFAKVLMLLVILVTIKLHARLIFENYDVSKKQAKVFQTIVDAMLPIN